MSKTTKGKTKKSETVESVSAAPVVDNEETGITVPGGTTADDFGSDYPTDTASSFTQSTLTTSDSATSSDTTEESTEDAPDAAQLRADIEETRAEMSETIDAIQEKLSPEHIKEQVKEKIHDATIGKAQHVIETVGEKLAPASDKLSEVKQTLADNVSEKLSTSHEKLSTSGDKIGEAKQSLVETAGETLEGVEHALEQVGHKIGDIAEPAAQAAQEKSDEFVRLVRRYPLPAAAIAVGVLVAGWFLFPHDND